MKAPDASLQNDQSRYSGQQPLSVLDAIPDVTIAFNHDWHPTYMNRAARDVLAELGVTSDVLNGASGGSAGSASIWDMLPELHGTQHHAAALLCLAEHRPVEIEDFYERLGRWYETRIIPTTDGIVSISREVTSRHRVDDALRMQSEVLRSMREGVSVSDEGGFIVYTNPAEDSMFGYEPGEMVGLNVKAQNAYPQEENERVVGEVIAQLQSDGAWSGEWENVRKDGTPFRTRARITAVHRGDRDYWVCVQEDITADRLAQDALRRSEDRFRRLVENTSVGLVIGDAQGGLSYMNPPLLQMLGYTADEVERGEVRWVNLTPPEFMEQDKRALHDLHTIGTAEPFEKVYVARSGERIPILVVPSVLDRDSDDDMTIAGFISDLRPLKIAERERDIALAEAQDARQDLQRVFNQAPVAIALVREPNHIFRIANPLYLELTGRQDDIVGKPVREALGELEGQGIFELMDQVYETGVPYVGNEIRALLSPGSGRADYEIYVNFVFQPVLDGVGAVYGIVIVAVDVTQQVRARVEAERLREVADAANLAKTQFLANVSHELRTPLNAIGGYTELMSLGIRGPTTAAQQEDLKRIARSQRHLLGLINDILNFARLEAGRVEFDLTSIRVRDIIGTVESLVAPQLQAKGIEYTWDVDGVRVMADGEKVSQVLLNLLSNAIKFTPSNGRITITSDADASDVRIHVHDTGIGIAGDRLDAIFEPFIQLSRTLSQPTEGTGLGLAISRDLARGMGGELTVESEPGKGSTFTLALKRAT
ncbi:MAG: PAS domain S-box protein [Gemmatimonadaceae bacterium]